MLQVDGSVLEGGGQLVRMAAALSALTGTPMELVNIRAGRERPGLRPQHCTALRAVAGTCSARVEGLAIGSRDLRFSPGPATRCSQSLDIGTAGSIPLVLQAWLPVALEKGGEITLTGGTEVAMSPTIDYFTRVFCPVLEGHGAQVETEILQRGYYPAGGGLVRVRAEPSALAPINLGAGWGSTWRGICSASSRLPAHVAERQAGSAARVLAEATGRTYPATLDARPGPGTGSSCTVWEGCRGSSELGRRGFPAERVGENAARGLVRALRSPWAVDEHLSDQLLVYIARYGGFYTSPSCSLHARTMCWLLSRFGYHIEVTKTPQGVEFRHEAPGP